MLKEASIRGQGVKKLGVGLVSKVVEKVKDMVVKVTNFKKVSKMTRSYTMGQMVVVGIKC